MERVDSDRTDESPFGSTLTTPVDEDVILFHGIEQRLIGKPHISHDEVEEGFTMIPNEGGGDVLFKSVDQKYTKPTDIPSLSVASDVELANTSINADILSQGTGRTTSETETIPEEAALFDEKVSVDSPRPID
ncbi:hypothetical protein C0992_009804 [Termitomyces sp. T32_za158]|nr:hypothetical protein C0992_009804 [Termitomyces sp. T32_za158]